MTDEGKNYFIDRLNNQPLPAGELPTTSNLGQPMAQPPRLSFVGGPHNGQVLNSPPPPFARVKVGVPGSNETAVYVIQGDRAVYERNVSGAEADAIPNSAYLIERVD